MLQAAGLLEWGAPDVEGMDPLPQDALKRVWASLLKARDRYRPSRKFDGPVLLFKAATTAAWTRVVYDDPLLGWERWATGPVEVHPVPGGHLDVFSLGNLAPLAAALRERLEALVPADGGLAAAG
jgi:thioesterase domain-containing protein